MEQVYKLVDQIYCINLISRPDRYEKMKAFETEEKITINFYRPEKDICGGMIGCFKSHINVVLDAYNKGYNQVLILEDDLIKTPSYNLINYKEIAKFIKENKTWETIQFSWCNILDSLFVPMLNTEYKNLSQFGSWYASSYIVNRKGMKRILDTYQESLGVKQIDFFYMELFKKTMWNVLPIPFEQDKNIPNDNNWINPTIDSIIIYIHLKLNLVYNLSLFKYYNGCFIMYAIIIFLIIKIHKISIQLITNFNKRSNH
jgi:GR25 family glycosyltransferase involved in LPS biosynthesis